MRFSVLPYGLLDNITNWIYRVAIRSGGAAWGKNSTFKQRNEVCFLYFLEGDKPEKGLDEAIKRVRQFYRL
jgi:hypothetical protein